MEVTKLAESLPNLQQSESKSICEQCQVRLRHTENGELKKWCKVCIDRWRTKQLRQENANIDQLVVGIVHELFLPARIEHLTEGIQEAFKALPEGRGLMLWGKAGVGKTYALAGFVRHYLIEGFSVKWTSYEMLCSQIRSSYQSQASETELQIINAYIEPDVVFLDDVGCTVSPGKSESDFSLRVLLTILDQRLNRCKATFITSNKSVEQLSTSFNEQIASRIQKICKVIQCKGEDRRTK